MSCDVRAELHEKWRIATEELATVVTALSGDVGTMPKDAYRALRARAEDVRLACDNAMLAVDFHEKDHGC